MDSTGIFKMKRTRSLWCHIAYLPRLWGSALNIPTIDFSESHRPVRDHHPKMHSFLNRLMFLFFSHLTISLVVAGSDSRSTMPVAFFHRRISITSRDLKFILDTPDSLDIDKLDLDKGVKGTSDGKRGKLFESSIPCKRSAGRECRPWKGTVFIPENYSTVTKKCAEFANHDRKGRFRGHTYICLFAPIDLVPDHVKDWMPRGNWAEEAENNHYEEGH